MLTPERLFRLTIELIFVLLGSLVIWLGLLRRIYVDRHGAAWLVLGGALIVWGLRALYSPGQWWLRWQNWTRGLSLVFLRVLLLVISRVPYLWGGPMLAAGGGLLGVCGLIASYLGFRPP